MSRLFVCIFIYKNTRVEYCMTRYFNETDTSFNNYYVDDVINELVEMIEEKD